MVSLGLDESMIMAGLCDKTSVRAIFGMLLVGDWY